MVRLSKTTLIAFIAVVFIASTGAAQSIDLSILESINPRHPNSQYWIETSSSAYWIPAAACFGTLAFGLLRNDKYFKVKAFELFVAVGGGILITEVIKPIVNRTRPEDAYPGLIFTSSPTHGASFPSGHATLAFSTASMIALEYKSWYVAIPAYLWAVTVVCSRMYLGKHYPSDVLSGSVIGIASSHAARWLNKKIFKYE
jgi:membrane-associated phospholipid phosphatase